MLFRIEFRNETSSIVNGRKEVLAYIRAMPEEIEDIRKVYKNGITDSVIDNYMVASEWFELKRGLREHTMTNYTWLYNQYVKESRLGKKKIKTVTFGDIKKHYNTLLDVRGLSVNTIDGLQTVLRQIFEYATKQRYIDINPTIDAMKELKKAHNSGENWKA